MCSVRLMTMVMTISGNAWPTGLGVRTVYVMTMAVTACRLSGCAGLAPCSNVAIKLLYLATLSLSLGQPTERC